MLLGATLPLDPGWRVVEGDLHDISRRVQEYDPDARLVRDDQSGALGLARIMRGSALMPEDFMIFAAHSLDPETGQRLYGEPDARVTRHQRIADGHTIANTTVWARRRRDALAAQRDAQKAERSEWSREHAKEFVWRRNRIDLGRRPTTHVPKEI